MEGKEIVEASNIVEGTILVYQRITKVLLDFGSTHSFVTPISVKLMGKKIDKLPYKLDVSMPIGRHMIMELVFRPCDIKIAAQVLMADLNSFVYTRYDIILEMVWLARHHTNLDY